MEFYISSGEGSAAAAMRSAEFKLLEAYCSRRRTTSNRRGFKKSQQVTPMLLTRSVQPEGPTTVPFRAALRCLGAVVPADELGTVADKLTQIADNVDIVTDVVCPDSDDYDIIQRLVEILRGTGDELDRELKKNPVLLKQLQSTFTYSLFEKVTRAFLNSVMPSWTGSTNGTQQTQIAMTCEVTSRLSILDLQPMNRVMGFGAQFLQQNFSGWVQKYGGWEKAFDVQEDEDEVQ